MAGREDHAGHKEGSSWRLMHLVVCASISDSAALGSLSSFEEDD